MNNQSVLIDPSEERQIIDFRLLGFHDVVVLGHYEYTCSHPRLEMHKHEQMIEICLLEKGRQVYLAEGREYVLEGGDVFITYPGEIHGSGEHPEAKGALYWLIFNVPRSGERFLSLEPAEWHVVLAPLLKRRPRIFRGTQQLKAALDQIVSIHTESDDPLRKVNLKNWMLRFLLDTIACAASPMDRKPSHSIQKILALINEKITQEEEIQLQTLARQADLSLSRFKARFRSEIGIPPAEYIARRKVEIATEWLLKSNLSVTEIAFRLGFSTSQYFSTVYRRFTGKSPSQVRKLRDSPHKTSPEKD